MFFVFFFFFFCVCVFVCACVFVGPRVVLSWVWLAGSSPESNPKQTPDHIHALPQSLLTFGEQLMRRVASFSIGTAAHYAICDGVVRWTSRHLSIALVMFPAWTFLEPAQLQISFRCFCPRPEIDSQASSHKEITCPCQKTFGLSRG